MKYKLWVSPEAASFRKTKTEGETLKTHILSMWNCFSEKKTSDKFCISFGRKENQDACFTVACSIKDAKHLANTILETLNGNS